MGGLSIVHNKKFSILSTYTLAIQVHSKHSEEIALDFGRPGGEMRVVPHL